MDLGTGEEDAVSDSELLSFHTTKGLRPCHSLTCSLGRKWDQALTNISS